MRNLYFLMVLFTGLTGLAFSPPVINQPSPINICDNNDDGYEVFDLASVIPQVLGSLDGSAYTVSFYVDASNAEVAANPITTPTAYVNSVMGFQLIYIRVEDNLNPANYAITQLELHVLLPP